LSAVSPARTGPAAACGPAYRVPVPVHLTVLSGPSGVGKSTVVARLRQEQPQIWQSVSVTTRPPRPGETHGREYYFVSERDFDAMTADGKLLEWAQFAGNKYGTPRGPVEERLQAGIATLLEIDVEGARQVRAALPGTLLVFLAPPSWDELVRRLTGRETEPADVIARRLEAARAELEAGSEFDITLVNTAVDDVCRQLVALMMAQLVH
jgi:guanylate kinase